MTVPTLTQDPRDPAFLEAPWGFYAALRATPVARWPTYGLVTARHAVIDAALRDRRLGRSAPAPVAHMPTVAQLDAASMLEREPPAHTRLRAQVLRAFTARRVAALGPEIAALAQGLADALPPGPVDLVPTYAERLPVLVIARLLGVPERHADDLLAWSHAMVALYQARRDRALEDRAERAATDMCALLRDILAARRASPRDDLLSALAASELSETDVLGTAVLLLNAGHEATVATLGNAVALILGEGRDPTQMASRAGVEEILRLEPPLHIFFRTALQPVDIGGVGLAPGDRIGLVLGAAGRDPAAAGHLAFGAGIHFCLGAPLARLELEIGLRTLFRTRPGLRLAAPPRVADRYHFRARAALLVEG